MELPENAILIVDGNAGQYAPQRFVEFVYDNGWELKNVDQYDMDVIETGPSHEEYWSAWDEIENNGTVLNDEGEFYIIHDMDIWIVPE